MKRFLIMLLSLMLLLSLAACKKDKNDQNAAPQTPVSSDAVQVPAEDEDGVKLPDGSIIYCETGISETASIEFKDEVGNVLLTAADIFKVSAKYFPENTYGIQLEFNESGTENFKTATQENVGKAINIYISGELVASPVIVDVINDDKVVISNIDFTKEKILELYDKLT